MTDQIRGAGPDPDAVSLPCTMFPFEDRPLYNGRRVRVIEQGKVQTWSGYGGLVGKVGVIVPSRRLPWADRQELPYGTVPVLMDDDIGCLTNIAYCGTDHLEFFDGEPITFSMARRLVAFVISQEEAYHYQSSNTVERLRWWTQMGVMYDRLALAADYVADKTDDVDGPVWDSVVGKFNDARSVVFPNGIDYEATPPSNERFETMRMLITELRAILD